MMWLCCLTCICVQGVDENCVVLVLGEAASYQLYSQQDTASLAY